MHTQLPLCARTHTHIPMCKAELAEMTTSSHLVRTHTHKSKSGHHSLHYRDKSLPVHMLACHPLLSLFRVSCLVQLRLSGRRSPYPHLPPARPERPLRPPLRSWPLCTAEGSRYCLNTLVDLPSVAHQFPERCSSLWGIRRASVPSTRCGRDR